MSYLPCFDENFHISTENHSNHRRLFSLVFQRPHFSDNNYVRRNNTAPSPASNSHPSARCCAGTFLSDISSARRCRNRTFIPTENFPDRLVEQKKIKYSIG